MATTISSDPVLSGPAPPADLQTRPHASRTGGHAGRATQSTAMQAVVQDRYGSSRVLKVRDIDKPAVGHDDVLVRVRAAGLASGDLHMMTGTPYRMRIMGFGLRAPKARVRGLDVAGTIEAIGNNVTEFQVGDDVFGTCDGSFAEYACARAGKLAHKPANLTFEQAAAVPVSAVTALQALRDKGEIRSGQKVLIVGASGGVGLFAVQIAKSFGAEVTGVCSTTKLDLVRSVGGDHVIDYTQDDFTKSGLRYDLILDLGGTRSLSQLRRVLTPKGTLVLVGGEGGDRIIGGALERTLRALVLSPFVSQRLRPVLGTPNAPDLKFLKELIESARLTPIIDRTYSLGEAPEAVRYLEEGHARGKVVIRVSGARTLAPNQ